MYPKVPNTLRAAASSSTGGLGFALGRRIGGAAAAPAAAGLAVPAAAGRGRSVCSTPAADAPPVPGDQGVGMEQPKQQQPKVPSQDAAAAGDKKSKLGDTHKTTTAKGDVMSHSFGEGYSTRSEEEGFGGVYGRNDPDHDEQHGTHIHPEYDTSQGSEVKEKEKARHLKDEKHATA